MWDDIAAKEMVVEIENPREFRGYAGNQQSIMHATGDMLLGKERGEVKSEM